MQATIYPSRLRGTIQANPSKSHAQRAIAVAALIPGTSVLSGTGESADVRAALSVAASMGAKITQQEHAIEITGDKLWTGDTWHCGESGLSFRMFSGIAGLGSDVITLSAEGSLLNRPVGFIENALNAFGVSARSTAGRPPLRIRGPYTRDIHVDGSLSSQFLTGLLIALPLMPHTQTLTVSDLVSKPYIDLTLETMRQFGVRITHADYETFSVTHGNYQPAEITIEGDWSGMAFLLACGALAGKVQIDGLMAASTQSDKAILEVLTQCGIPYTTLPASVSIEQTDLIPAFEIDATDCPDLVPVLVALAVHARGTSRIHGVHRLRNKESDRAATLQSEFAKIGAAIHIENDTLLVEGGMISGGTVQGHGDHRIVMALATAALRGTEPVTITGAEAIEKSYPGFFTHLAALDAQITLQ